MLKLAIDVQIIKYQNQGINKEPFCWLLVSIIELIILYLAEVITCVIVYIIFNIRGIK